MDFLNKLEEEKDAVKDIAEDVPENENETEKSNSLEEENADDKAQEPTEKSSAADQVAPIGLRELRYVWKIAVWVSFFISSIGLLMCY